MEFDDSLHGGPCPLCLKLGQDWLLKLSPLNDEEAVFFCTNPECAYPIGTPLDVRSEWVVPFRLRDWIRRSTRKRHNTGSSGTGSLGRSCTNLANTSASGSPLCHLSSTQTSPALSTISTISSTSSKQPKVSPIQLDSLNSPGTLDAGSSFQGNLEARNSTSIEEEGTSIIKTDGSLTGLSLFDIDNGTSVNRQNNENIEQCTEKESSLTVSSTKASGQPYDRPGQSSDAVIIDTLEEAYKERIGEKLAVCTNDGQQSKGLISASPHYGVQIQCYGGSTDSEAPNASVGNRSSNCEIEHVFSTDCATSFDYAKPIAPSGMSQLSSSPPLFDSIEGGVVSSYFPLSSMVEVAKPLNASVCYDIDEDLNLHQDTEQTEDYSFLGRITAAEENQPLGQTTMPFCSREVTLPINVETPSFSVYSDLDTNYSFDPTNQKKEESVSDQKLAGSGQNYDSLQNGINTSLGVIPVDITLNEFTFETMMGTDEGKIKEELDISSEGAKNDSEIYQGEVTTKSEKDEFLQKLSLQKLMKHFQRKLKNPSIEV
ncbi:uncharacterized protein LOC136040877 [Artemia franciscana]|uniref:Uncharacterized protein n=1 Tax=Artemia franciscana TaxID=6661 RepID=A0AA88L1T2_ARTSF|nr:hypothetical protein QYM36_009285 [Artemia franciscana]